MVAEKASSAERCRERIASIVASRTCTSWSMISWASKIMARSPPCSCSTRWRVRRTSSATASRAARKRPTSASTRWAGTLRGALMAGLSTRWVKALPMAIPGEAGMPSILW